MFVAGCGAFLFAAVTVTPFGDGRFTGLPILLPRAFTCDRDRLT
jgi:hypothetical protein